MIKVDIITYGFKHISAMKSWLPWSFVKGMLWVDEVCISKLRKSSAEVQLSIFPEMLGAPTRFDIMTDIPAKNKTTKIVLTAQRYDPIYRKGLMIMNIIQ